MFCEGLQSTSNAVGCVPYLQCACRAPRPKFRTQWGGQNIPLMFVQTLQGPSSSEPSRGAFRGHACPSHCTDLSPALSLQGFQHVHSDGS